MVDETATTGHSWHVGGYGLLGWIETAIKAAAFICAHIAFAHAVDRHLHSPGAVRVAELVLLGTAELGLIAAIGDRLIERELIAVGFVVFNNVAHLGMLYALLATPGPGGLLSLFCAFMLGGELTKLGWLRATGFTVRKAAPLVVQGFVVAYAAIYAGALVLWQLAT